MARLGQTGVGSGEVIVVVVAKGLVVVIVIISIALAQTATTAPMRCCWLITSRVCALDNIVVLEFQ